MSPVSSRRDDIAYAESIMRRTCPDEKARSFLMSRLLDSVALAEQSGPRSWAVTLFEAGFRLNVGQVEAYAYLNRVVRFYLLGPVPARAHTVGEIVSSSFRSMPQPQLAFYGSPKELERIHKTLAPAHARYVQTAAVTAKGKPRRSSYLRYHSPGLYNYAVHLSGANKAGDE